MVEQIEELGAILQPAMFGNRNVLQHREINVEVARSYQDVASGIAESP